MDHHGMPGNRRRMYSGTASTSWPPSGALLPLTSAQRRRQQRQVLEQEVSLLALLRRSMQHREAAVRQACSFSAFGALSYRYAQEDIDGRGGDVPATTTSPMVLAREQLWPRRG